VDLKASNRNGTLNKVSEPFEAIISDVKTDLKETGREDGSWMKLAQDRVQWQALVLAVLS
jgi:hypothetical protein